MDGEKVRWRDRGRDRGECRAGGLKGWRKAERAGGREEGRDPMTTGVMTSLSQFANNHFESPDFRRR